MFHIGNRIKFIDIPPLNKLQDYRGTILEFCSFSQQPTRAKILWNTGVTSMEPLTYIKCSEEPNDLLKELL